MISNNYILIIILLVLLVFNFNNLESYVILNCNSKNIPKDMIKYQKKCKSNNYGFIPRSLYPDIVNLVNNYSDKLRNEFNNKDGIKIFKYIKPINNCKYFYLIKNGNILNQSNKFPIIIKLIKTIPNVKNASLSCLDPNTKTKIHNNFNNKYYRVHIPMFIPKGKTGICVEKECRTWKYNQFLLVDENLMHQVWNFTNKPRVILLLDVDKVEFNKN